MKDIGQRVRSLRLRLGKNQAEFAEMLGFSLWQVSAWETGKTVVSAELIQQIARLYPAELLFLLIGEERSNQIRESTGLYGQKAEAIELAGQVANRPRLLAVVQRLIEMDPKLIEDSERLAKLLDVPVEIAALVLAMKKEKTP